jgi:hypothetical protein
MYAVEGRTWVALGDPVGPPERLSDLIRLFLERCDDFGGVPVFYQISKTTLHRYADFGLTFVKLGEEALVDLRTLTFEGGEARKFRQALRRLEKEGATFRVIDAGRAGVIDQLREVSDDWLREKAGGEKGFSLGYFRPDYLMRFPVAVIERGGRIEAFANIWPGPQTIEMSADLMPLPPRPPRGTSWKSSSSPDAVGPAAGLPVPVARHGAAVRLRSVAGRAALEPAGIVSLRARRGRSTTSRACGRTRRSSTRCGSPATWPTPAG